MTLIPSSKPEFLIVVNSGRQYRISPQAVGEISSSEGTVLQSSDFQIGMKVRATVLFNQDSNGGLGGLSSTDFTILAE
jgi:hypothetical protein